MNTTENNKYVELENILSFLGVIFINYKGRRTSNGHKTAKTTKEITEFFGKEVMTSGMFIEDIELYKMFDFKNDWNWLMFVVEKIESIDFEVSIRGNSVTVCNNSGKNPYFQPHSVCENKINSVYTAVVKFIKWYNEQKS